MKIISFFLDSFRMLYREPRLFIPRLITTALYTGVMIYLASLAARVVSVAGGPRGELPARDKLYLLFSDLMTLAGFLVFLMAIDLISYAMYPALVRDHQGGRKIRLVSSLREALRAWKVLLLLGLVIILIAIAAGVFIMPVAVLFPQIIRQYGITAYLALASLALVMALVPMMLLFFVVPAGVIEKKGVVASFTLSANMGIKHGKDVFAINLSMLSITVAVYAFMVYAGVYAQGAAAFYSTLAFIAVRLIQTVVYTHISVVNPYVYMKLR